MNQLINFFPSRFISIWDELQHYMQLPVSHTTTLIVKERDEERVYQFLMGLNDSMYGTVRSSIIPEEPLTKVKSVFARIWKKEQYRNLARTTTVGKGGGIIIGGAFIVVKAASNLALTTRPICNHCLKP